MSSQIEKIREERDMTKSHQMMMVMDKIITDLFNIHGLQKSCKEDRPSIIDPSLQIRKLGFREFKVTGSYEDQITEAYFLPQCAFYYTAQLLGLSAADYIFITPYKVTLKELRVDRMKWG